MSKDIKYTYININKSTGASSYKTVYTASKPVSVRYQLRYYYLQGYTDIHSQIIDILNKGESPTSSSLEDHKKDTSTANKYSNIEKLFQSQFHTHTKEIMIEGDILDIESLKESKESQKSLESFLASLSDTNSLKHVISGVLSIVQGQPIEESVKCFEEGHRGMRCQFSAVRLLRMILETRELSKESSDIRVNFQKAVDIIGHVFTTSGVFDYIEKDFHHCPLFHYLSVMMDIDRDFREFVYSK